MTYFLVLSYSKVAFRFAQAESQAVEKYEDGWMKALEI
jgi:hypothetical protein